MSPPQNRAVARVSLTLAVALLLSALAPRAASALGETSLFDVRVVSY